jgi:hypothetical protein
LSSTAKAVAKKEFNIAWTIYVGWMPWPYAAEAGIVKKWADKYGIAINITQINDYVVSSIASRRHAAIDDDFGAGDEARFIGGEKQRGVRGVAAVTHESERDASDPLLEERRDVAAGTLPGEPRFHHRCVQLSRNHGVYPDAVLGVLNGNHAGELDNAGFGGGICNLRRAAETNAGG